MSLVFFIIILITNLYSFNVECVVEDFSSIEDIILQEEIDILKYINAEEETEVKLNFITISLGCNCNAAAYTRKYNLRNYAFPFDWCLTPYRALYHFIGSDFKDYWKKENLVPSLSIHFTDYMRSFFMKLGSVGVSEYFTWVLDKETGMIFNHDFPDNKPSTIDKNYQPQYLKYMRRIERLYNVMKSNKHIYFIRYLDITKSESYELCQLLKSKFPNSSFTLIVIGNNAKEFTENWNLPNIKNLYSPHGNDSFWKNLCAGISANKFL